MFAWLGCLASAAAAHSLDLATASVSTVGELTTAIADASIGRIVLAAGRQVMQEDV